MSSDSIPAIFLYTRRMAIADGVLVDATQGIFAAVSREHFPEHHLAMTDTVFDLIEKSVSAREGADATGLWHDILWMSRVCPVRLCSGGHTFRVKLRTRHGSRWYDFKILFHGGDHGEPCATVMRPDED